MHGTPSDLSPIPDLRPTTNGGVIVSFELQSIQLRKGLEKFKKCAMEGRHKRECHCSVCGSNTWVVHRKHAQVQGWLSCHRCCKEVNLRVDNYVNEFAEETDWPRELLSFLGASAPQQDVSSRQGAARLRWIYLLAPTTGRGQPVVGNIRGVGGGQPVPPVALWLVSLPHEEHASGLDGPAGSHASVDGTLGHAWLDRHKAAGGHLPAGTQVAPGRPAA